MGWRWRWEWPGRPGGRNDLTMFLGLHIYSYREFTIPGDGLLQAIKIITLKGGHHYSLYFRSSLPTLQIICSCSAFVTKYLLYCKVMKARGAYSADLGVAGSGSGMEVGVAWRWEWPGCWGWHRGGSYLEMGVV